MTIFKHSGGWINLDHVIRVVPVPCSANKLRMCYADSTAINAYVDVSGPEADRLRLILDALELVVQEPPKPVAKAELDIKGEMWVFINVETREPGYHVYPSRKEAEKALPYISHHYELIRIL